MALACICFVHMKIRGWDRTCSVHRGIMHLKSNSHCYFSKNIKLFLYMSEWLNWKKNPLKHKLRNSFFCLWKWKDRRFFQKQKIIYIRRTFRQSVSNIAQPTWVKQHYKISIENQAIATHDPSQKCTKRSLNNSFTFWLNSAIYIYFLYIYTVYSKDQYMKGLEDERQKAASGGERIRGRRGRGGG